MALFDHLKQSRESSPHRYIDIYTGTYLWQRPRTGQWHTGLYSSAAYLRELWNTEYYCSVGHWLPPSSTGLSLNISSVQAPKSILFIDVWTFFFWIPDQSEVRGQRVDCWQKIKAVQRWKVKSDALLRHIRADLLLLKSAFLLTPASFYDPLFKSLFTFF